MGVNNSESRKELARLAQKWMSVGKVLADDETSGEKWPRDKRMNAARMLYRLALQCEYARRALLYLAQSGDDESISVEAFSEEREDSFLTGHDAHDALMRVSDRRWKRPVRRGCAGYDRRKRK